MNSRQRVLCALNHVQPDRAPTDLQAVDEVRKKLGRFFMTTDREEILKMLEIDFGFNKTLQRNGFNQEKSVTTKDVWGYMDSQETVSISPNMFGEFFYPFYMEVAQHFGLLNYGCCEPVNSIWEKYISKLPNLRKVSISPWCDEEYMGQALRGTNVIYHRKPSPNYIGVGKVFDEEAFRKHIMKTIKSAQGCKLEFSFRDVYTVEGDIYKPGRAIKVVRELLEKYWK